MVLEPRKLKQLKPIVKKQPVPQGPRRPSAPSIYSGCVAVRLSFTACVRIPLHKDGPLIESAASSNVLLKAPAFTARMSVLASGGGCYFRGGRVNSIRGGLQTARQQLPYPLTGHGRPSDRQIKGTPRSGTSSAGPSKGLCVPPPPRPHHQKAF